GPRCEQYLFRPPPNAPTWPNHWRQTNRSPWPTASRPPLPTSLPLGCVPPRSCAAVPRACVSANASPAAQRSVRSFLPDRLPLSGPQVGAHPESLPCAHGVPASPRDDSSAIADALPARTTPDANTVPWTPLPLRSPVAVVARPL